MQEAIRALRQGSKPERIAAIHVLGRFEQPGAVQALVMVLQDEDDDIRSAAMGKLVFAGNKALVPALLAGLGDPAPLVRRHSLYALQRVKATSAADRIARLMLRDPDEFVRFNAALALADVATPRHAKAFARALDDANVNVMYTALTALARLTPRRISAHVLRLVGDTKRWNGIAQTLKDVVLRLMKDDLGNKEVAALLRKIVNDGLREARREGKASYSMDVMEAACLLAEAGDAIGLPVLVAAMRRGGEYGGERGARMAARLKAASAVPAVIDGALANGFFPVKIKAVTALGDIGDPAALPTLASFFNDRVDDFFSDRSAPFAKDDLDLRLRALAAMATIAMGSLRKAARAGDAFEKKTARRLLDEMKQRD